MLSLSEMWNKMTQPGWYLQVVNLIIISVCLISKIPQIYNLQNRRPSEIRAVSCYAIIMEIIGYTIMTMYNIKNDYSVMTYLEYPVLLVQMYFMLFVVLRAKGYLILITIPATVTMIYGLIVLLFMFEVIPVAFLNFIVPICTPLSGFAKVGYIMGILKTQNSDAVSLETWAMSVATNGARFFCVLADSGDINLMVNYFVSVVLSAGVLAAAIYYQMYPVPRVVISTRRREPSVRRQYHID
ncbi:solute carrier family 66 member 3 [Colias croceus]|uniref:solute carrier family 66 member 3 n=1 Tax=Colias crocea TaxID=72248 RepID=UPI001E280E89|nr:solute carrier family 66 member 3 [Colias croceus]XP_045509817.1 solute carrier family 66 member 3 [Colias croceus]